MSIAIPFKWNLNPMIEAPINHIELRATNEPSQALAEELPSA
jgi:hypothetical protein